MKLILVASLLSVAVADKLTNVYLPPAGARTAGGSSRFLSTPLQANQPINQVVRSQFPSTTFGNSQLNYQTRSQYSGRPAQITRYINENNGDGSYQFDYETENKISQYETGQLRNAGSNQEATVVQGSYSYAAPDGQVYTVDYVADENGFQPRGSHLPTPPPIPDAILKSLQRNAAAGAAEYNSQYRQYNNGAYKQGDGYRY